MDTIVVLYIEIKHSHINLLLYWAITTVNTV